MFEATLRKCMFLSSFCMMAYRAYLCVSEFTRYVLEYSDKAFIDFHSLPQVKFILWSFQTNLMLQRIYFQRFKLELLTLFLDAALVCVFWGDKCMFELCI